MISLRQLYVIGHVNTIEVWLFCHYSHLCHLGFSEILFYQANLPNLPQQMDECIYLIGGLLGHIYKCDRLKCWTCQMGDLFCANGWKCMIQIPVIVCLWKTTFDNHCRCIYVQGPITFYYIKLRRNLNLVLYSTLIFCLAITEVFGAFIRGFSYLVVRLIWLMQWTLTIISTIYCIL